MGCLFAARLANGGVQTTLVDHRADRAKRLNAAGIRVESDTGSLSANPAVSTAIPDDQDLLIVFVKSHVTHALTLPAGVPVLTLQSGLGNTEALCSAVGSAHVLAGVTHEAAMLDGEGSVTHTAAARTAFGSSRPADGGRRRPWARPVRYSHGGARPDPLEKVAASNAIYPLTACSTSATAPYSKSPKYGNWCDLVVESVKVVHRGYRFATASSKRPRNSA